MATASYQGDKGFNFAGIWIPSWLSYTFCLFVLSRIALTAIGLTAYSVIAHKDMANYSGILKLWDVWDSDSYIAIAKNWYPKTTDLSHMKDYVFLPLYPLLMKLVAFAADNYLVAGLIVSNVSLFVACYYMYKLARLDSDEPAALRSIKYLLLFPTAFILSGVLTESLFLALSLACYYYARKGNWLASGVLGALASITRPYGIVILVPMALEYLRSINFDIRKATISAAAMLLPPLGMALLMAYDYSMTGDFLAFIHAQTLWYFSLRVPLIELLKRFVMLGNDGRFNAAFTVAVLLLLLAGYRKIGISQLTYGLLLIVIPLCSIASAWSMSRYALVVFPLFLILAGYAENRKVDLALTVGLALAQGLLMASWTTWGFYVI